MLDHEQLLTELLNKIVTERALVAPHVKIQPITSIGTNFTSQLFQASIIDGDNRLNLFAKVAAVGEKFREQLPTKIFETENTFYTKLNKIYENLQEKHNVPQEKRFVPPKCYGCSGKLYEEVLVLEDLSAQGFTVYDRMKSVDWDYASKAVEEIAKFHALSVAFEKENKEEFDKFMRTFKFIWDYENNTYITDMINKGLGVVKKENKSRLEAFLASFASADFDEIFKPVKLKCDRVEIKIIDYQTVRGASPIIDLLYFIFTGTDEQFRAQHYERLLDHYYTELNVAMKRLGLNPEEIYTREDFDFEYKTKLPFGLSLAMITLPVVTVDAANAPKVDKDKDMTSFAMDNSSDIYPKKLNGIVNDFIRCGLL